MKIRVRMANELFHDVLDVEQEDFVVEHVFDNEVFGWWKNCAYISIPREDYNKFLVKKGGIKKNLLI